MFGIKIISKKEYNELKANAKAFLLYHPGTVEQVVSLSKDMRSLRQQLNDQMAECRKLKDANDYLRQFKRDTLEALANIDLGSFRLQVCKSKCDTCDQEHTDCKKYSFGSLSFCVIPKQQPSKE